MANNEKLHIEVTADTSRVTRGMDVASRELRKMERLVQQAGTTMEKAFSPAQLKGIQAYRDGLQQSRKSMAEFQLKQMAIQGEFMNLASSTDKYGGNTKKLMKDIEQLGLQDKKVKESMINNNKRVHAEFYRTIGAVMARSTQSQAISENFTRMKNPLYAVNKPLLAISHGLENIVKKGQPAALALKMLGPTASMKDLQKMQRTITAGLMRFQMVAMGAAVVAGVFYTKMYKAAMGPNPSEVRASQAEVTKIYTDALASRVSEIANFSGLFDKAVLEPINRSKLTSALESQVNVLEVWTDNMASLTKRGIDEGLMKELQQIGPDGAAEVAALNRMTDAELQNYVGLWKEKMALATDQATTELQDLKAKTDAEVKKLQDSLMPLGVATEGLKTAMTKALAPMVKLFGDLMTPVVNFATRIAEMRIEFNKSHPTAAKLLDAFLLLIPALTLLLSPLAVGIGLFGGFQAALASLWMFIGPVVTGLAAMMGTVLVVSAAIVAAGYLIYKNWDTIKAYMLPIFETIKTKATTAFNNMKAVILKAVDAVVKFAVPIWGKIVEALKQMWTSAQPVIMKLWNYIQEAFTAISDFIASIMPTVMDIIQGAWDFIKVVIEFAVKHILPLVTSAFDSIMKIINASMDFIVPLIKTSWDFMKVLISSALGIIKNVIGFVMNIIDGDWAGAWDNIKNILSLAWEVVKKAVDTAIKFIQVLLDKGMDLLKSIWDNGWDIVKQVMSTVWEVIKQLFGKAVTALWAKMIEFKDYIVKKFNELKDQGIAKVKALWEDVKKRFFDAAVALRSKVIELKDNIVNKFNELKNKAVEKFQNLKTDVKKKFEETVTDLIAKAKALPGKIGEGISNAAKDAVQGVKDLGKKIIDTFKEKLGIHSPSRVFEGLGQYVIEGLKNGLSWENIKKFATNIFGDVTDGALGTFNTIKDFFSGNSLSGIKSFFGGIKDYAGGAFGSVKDLFSGSIGTVGSGVQQWAGVATKALMMTGQFSKANLDRLLYQMQTESGGNAKAINLWDINAKNGVPSKGLMQVIDPTFAAYKMPGYNNIWNPLDNILASIRYAVARYGSLGNAYRGVGYATGGIFNGSKDGVMARIAEGHGNEAVVPLSNKTRMKPFAHAVADMIPEKDKGSREDVNVTYEFTIPVEIDGRVVAQATAKFTQEELDKMARRNRRQMGQA